MIDARPQTTVAVRFDSKEIFKHWILEYMYRQSAKQSVVVLGSLSTTDFGNIDRRCSFILTLAILLKIKDK